MTLLDERKAGNAALAGLLGELGEVLQLFGLTCLENIDRLARRRDQLADQERDRGARAVEA